MKRIRSRLFFGALLTTSLAFSGTGWWLAYRAALHLDRDGLRIGVALLFAGMTVVPVALGFLVNYFFPSERIRLRASQHSKRSAKIRKLENGLRYSHFIKRHPMVIPLFCFGALIVSTRMALAPPSLPNQQVVFLHGMGIVLGLAYFVILIFFSYARLTNRWERYMNASISKAEARLAKMKEAQIMQAAPPKISDGHRPPLHY